MADRSFGACGPLSDALPLEIVAACLIPLLVEMSISCRNQLVESTNLGAPDQEEEHPYRSGFEWKAESGSSECQLVVKAVDVVVVHTLTID